jgi:peptidoglycan/LPS O-acetylase OafA/YrhL
VWPFLFSALALKRSAVYVTAACLGFATLRGAMILIKPAAYIQGVYYMRPYYRFDSILIGAALVLWLASSPNVVKKLRGLFSFVPAALFWIGLLLWTGFGERISRAAYLSIQEVLVAAVLAQLVLCDRTFVAAIFRSRILRYFGAISYSLYLWQQLFLVTSTPSWGRMRELPLCVVVPMVIATASFYLIEKPVLQIKESLAP